MLTNYIGLYEKAQREALDVAFKEATGAPNPYAFWEPKAANLPNLKPITERDFWGLFTQKTPKAIMWFGQERFVRTDTGNLSPCTVKLLWYDSQHMASAGHLAAYFHDYGNERVQYYSFSGCDHDWKEHSPRMCYHVVTCPKCKATYDYHSD